MRRELLHRTSDVQAKDPNLGDPDAPLTLLYFADFRCPSSRAFEASEAHRTLQEDHVEPGHVRVVFVNLPVTGEDARLAAEASHAVWREAPEAYWAWHARLMASEWSGLDGLLAQSTAFADVDRDALGAVLREGRFREEVARDQAEAAEWRVPRTPTLLLDGERVAPLELDTVLRRALA